jgi:hypothetical protein
MNIYSDVALVLWNRDVIELVSMILLTRNLKARGIEPSDDVAQVEEFILTCAPTSGAALPSIGLKGAVSVKPFPRPSICPYVRRSGARNKGRAVALGTSAVSKAFRNRCTCRKDSLHGETFLP